MPVRVVCPSCSTALSVKDEHAGRAIKCPKCSATVQGMQTIPAQTNPPGSSVSNPGGSPLAPPQLPDEIGRLGPYRVLGELGAGGMGVVYRAEDTALNRTVAVKVMLPQFAADAKIKARFTREAQAQARVEHDHVATIYQVGEHAGVLYIVMPLLKGQSLAATLKQNPRQPLRKVLRIAREMADGLAAAHAAGLIHRDIKPGNVWLEGPKQRVKILDFGLARSAAGSEAGEALTHSGAVLGTPAYMSPEQARAQKVDHRTDLFSLGVVLYQMATGQQPFVGESVFDVMNAVVNSHPVPAHKVESDLPVALGKLIARLLEKNPDDRPADAPAVVAKLTEIEQELDERSESGTDRTRTFVEKDRAEEDEDKDEDESEQRGRGRRNEDRRDRRNEDHDRGTKSKRKSRSTVLLVIAAGLLLMCCVPVGGFVYLVRETATERSAAERDYDQLSVGGTTRAQAESALGKGRPATYSDLESAFGSDQRDFSAWTGKVAQGRVMIWRHGSYFILAAFQNTGSDARLQAKAWGLNKVVNARSGELDDARLQTPASKK